MTFALALAKQAALWRESVITVKVTENASRAAGNGQVRGVWFQRGLRRREKLADPLQNTQDLRDEECWGLFLLP